MQDYSLKMGTGLWDQKLKHSDKNVYRFSCHVMHVFERISDESNKINCCYFDLHILVGLHAEIVV